MSSNELSALKPSFSARTGSKRCGQPATMREMTGSGSRLMSFATFSPAMRRSASICSPTVTQTPGIERDRRGPTAAVSSVAAWIRKFTAARVRPAHDPLVARIVEGWPQRIEARRARELGFKAESSFDEIIRIHIDAELGGSFVA